MKHQTGSTRILYFAYAREEVTFISLSCRRALYEPSGAVGLNEYRKTVKIVTFFFTQCFLAQRKLEQSPFACVPPSAIPPSPSPSRVSPTPGTPLFHGSTARRLQFRCLASPTLFSPRSFFSLLFLCNVFFRPLTRATTRPTKLQQ